MQLVPVSPTHIDLAWRDGASCLARACDSSGGEITGDQLKLILARGERTLLQMNDEGQVVGWGVVRIDQLPNVRVFFVTDMVAPRANFERFWNALQKLAADHGCSRIRCAAKPSQERLYRIKTALRPLYQILEAEVSS